MAFGDPNDPTNQQQQSGPRFTVDNQYKQDQGFQNRNTYGGQVGGADAAVNRYRQMGSMGADRGAYQANYGLFNAAGDAQAADRGVSYADRGQQQGAVDLLRQGAVGAAPSAAEELGHRQTDDSIAASLAVANSAKGGPMAQAAAIDAAQKQGFGVRAQANRDIMATRANEIANYRNALMGGTTSMRQGDFTAQGLSQGEQGLALQQTGQDIQNQQFQRGLNQQDQQFYEQQANQVNLAQLAADQGAQHEADASFAANQGVRQGDEGLSWDKLKTISGAATGAASGVLGLAASDAREKVFTFPMARGTGPEVAPAFPPHAYPPLTYSDERSKQQTFPMGRQAPMGALPPWMPPYSLPDSLLTSDAHSKHEQRALGQQEGFQAAQDAGLNAPMGGTSPAQIAKADAYAKSFAPQPPHNPTGPGTLWNSMQPPPGPTPGMPAQGQPPGALGRIGAGFGGMSAAFNAPHMYGSDPALKDELTPLAKGSPGFGWTAAGYRPDLQMQQENSMMRGAMMHPGASGPSNPLVTSDNRAKLAAAYDAGHEAGAQSQGAFVESVLGPPPTSHAPQPRAAATPKEPLYVAQGQRTGYASADADTSHRMSPGYGATTYPFKRVGNAEPPPPPAAPPAQMMDAIGSGKTFKYKPGVPDTNPNEQKFGTTTQDLRQTPMGASMVTVDPRTGYEAIDTREAVGPTLASLGNLNQRLRALETKKGRR